MDFAGWSGLADTSCTDADAVDNLAEGPRLACRLVNCIDDMSHVTFANPAGEVCDDIKACIMLTGDTESKEGFAAMCDRPDWKYGLNQVLTAVAVLDADPNNSLDDINSLFGCTDDSSTCVFEDSISVPPIANMYQQGVPLDDDGTNCPTGTGRRSLEQAMADQENRKTGIITAGFIIPGMQKFHTSNSGSNRFDEAQTIAWWETTTWASTTEKPKIGFKPSNNRGLETVTEAPTADSFHQVMTMATTGSTLDPWDKDTGRFLC